jgi:hypothetical protein
LIVACNGLGLTYITDLLGRVMLFAPKLLVALLVVIFGSYCARFVGGVVRDQCREARIPDADILGRITRYLIMTFVVMIALSQVEVGGDIVQRTFLVILAGLVLALALAFGLGGREWAADVKVYRQPFVRARQPSKPSSRHAGVGIGVRNAHLRGGHGTKMRQSRRRAECACGAGGYRIAFQHLAEGSDGAPRQIGGAVGAARCHHDDPHAPDAAFDVGLCVVGRNHDGDERLPAGPGRLHARAPWSKGAMQDWVGTALIHSI